MILKSLFILYSGNKLVAIQSVSKLQNNVIRGVAGALGYTFVFDMLEIGS